MIRKSVETLTQYLRNFALWCRNGFADKLSSKQALPGVMLIGYDSAGNPTNATYMLTIKAGAVTLTSDRGGTGGAVKHEPTRMTRSSPGRSTGWAGSTRPKIILHLMAIGRMQLLTKGHTIAVTQVAHSPRARCWR